MRRSGSMDPNTLVFFVLALILMILGLAVTYSG
jgi:hypothetical protein